MRILIEYGYHLYVARLSQHYHPHLKPFLDQIFIPMDTMRYCTTNMHWWEVGEMNVEVLLMKQSISELYGDMKMTSEVGIRCGFFGKDEPVGTTSNP